MNIALIQKFFVIGNPFENAKLLINEARKTEELGVQLCIAPELAISGPLPADLLLGMGLIKACHDALDYLAKELADSIPLLLGSPMHNPVPLGKPMHNCAVLIAEGRVRIVSRKVLLASQNVFDEPRYFEPGMSTGILDLAGWRFAVTMAEDMLSDRTLFQKRHPNEYDPVAQCLASGADALLCLGALPVYPAREALQERALAGVAARYRLPVVFVNHVGAADGVVFSGNSVVFAPTGMLLVRAAQFEEDVLCLDLTTGKKIKQKQETNFIIREPFKTKEEKIWAALKLALRSYVQRNDFDKVFLGLSGGLDSAVVAILAVEALGADKVIAVFMPSVYTSKESREGAYSLVKNLNIELKEIVIDNLIQEYSNALSLLFSGLPADITEENIQARIRGNLLMALANKFKGIVLCTGNKSEIAVGYSTLYGDSIGAIAVLGDIYKSEVKLLALWYNKEKGYEVIPDLIINREPSAELKFNQKDSDLLPSYSELDEILEKYIEQGLSTAEIIRLGFEEEKVKNIVGMIKRAEYKRFQFPPCVQVADRSFGQGWRMPLTTSGLVDV